MKLFSSSAWVFFKERGVFLVVLLITASIIHSSLSASGQKEALTQAQKKLEEAQSEQKRLEELKRGVNSTEFVEREARDKLGLVKEGEVIVVLPPEDVLRRLAPAPLEDEGFGEEHLSVWRQWTRLFLPELEKSLPEG